MGGRSEADIKHTEKMMREARLAERERCAKLVEALGKVSSDDVIWQAAQSMAAEIRKQ